ncbi:AAA family ATPase [Acidithiobacillus ferrivorans]|nr:AAA family ATPase [Acidithiobacillus ferrivorans]
MADSIIAVMNQKGGTGKTTLALNLAAGLARRAATHLVDADPQGSISQWVAMAAAHTGLPAVAQPGADPSATIAQLACTHRYVVVDCPPAIQGDLVAAVMRSVQVILIPVLPSPIDLWASVGMAAALGEARHLNPGLRAGLVLNQLETRNALSRAMREALAEFDIPILQAGMQRRAAYRSAAVEGTSVYGLGKRAQAAVADMEAIIEEVLCL